MNDSAMRERLLLPVLIPVGALAFVGFLALGMASVLLNVPHNVATAVALMVAFNLLVGFSVAAMRPNIGKPMLLLMVGIAVFPVLLGAGVAAGVIPVEDAHAEEEAAGASVDVSAKSLTFDTAALEAPADEEFEIHFNNSEAQPHNVAILEAAGSPNVLFRGAIITGPKETTYKVDPIAAGSYHFQCDVHPNMSGTIVVG